MADAEENPENTASSRRYWPRRKRWQFLLALLVLLAISSILTWRSREAIVGNLIESELGRLGIEASYTIDSIDPTRQVLRDFVIGEPERPDLSIERIELVPVVGFFSVEIGSVTLVNPRLRATYYDGKLSLGALDPLLEMESDGPPELPDWRLKLVDGRARIFSDYGVVGVKAEGDGRLSGGFSGVLAAAGPQLAVDGCKLDQMTLVGKLAVTRGQPGFAGPLRLASAECEEIGLALGNVELATDITVDRDLARVDGKLRLKGGPASFGQFGSKGLGGSIDASWRDGNANARYDLALSRIDSPALTLDRLKAQGAARIRPADGRYEVDAGIDGVEPRLGADANEALAEWRKASAGTLAEPLLARFAQGLAKALPGSAFTAEARVRQSDEGLNIVIPAARLSDQTGEALLAASQLQYGTNDTGEARLAGNFATGGNDLPRIRARMEAGDSGRAAWRLEMEPYTAGTSRLAVPRLVLDQDAAGGWQIDGRLETAGPLPSGVVEGLSLPITGRWSDRSGLAMWQQCTDVRFERLELAQLALSRNRLRFCPDVGSAILRSTSAGLAFDARTEALSLAGDLDGSPIAMTSGPVRASSRDGFSTSNIVLTLGNSSEQSRLAIDRLQASFSDGIGGIAEGIAGGLAVVPLDISSGNAEWSYADGALTLTDANFELSDRVEEGGNPRFYPLVARDAVLTLDGGAVSSMMALRNPDSDRVVTEVTLQHDLGSGKGSARLATPGLRFDDGLQPDQLSILADGVVALAEGTISGNGRIDWDADGITSTGEFSSDDFDFAAAFGPVQQVSGTVTFSDLLSLTTDGTQSLKIGSINPGIEVFDGVFDFALRDGTLISIKGGRWPFFGGIMVLRPTELNLSVSEERSYVIEITGADAAQFIAAMELGNIAATGVFDGTVPLIFDEMGNGEIRNGLLISRPPGGNLSYVGELTYEDMGVMANFAFQSLRSLDFSQMMVEMNGPLTGEIITRLLFDGVRQGEGTSSNFLTRRIAKLPIRFNVNIRAAFYELLTSLRSTYDPAFIRDPRGLGLLRSEGGQFVRPRTPDQPAIRPRDIADDESLIQTDESEPLP